MPRPVCHSIMMFAQVTTQTESSSVPPTWHFANPNVQVSGVRFAVRAAHAKVRRGGYRAQFPGGADARGYDHLLVPASRSSLAETRPPMGQATCFTR